MRVAILIKIHSNMTGKPVNKSNNFTTIAYTIVNDFLLNELINIFSSVNYIIQECDIITDVSLVWIMTLLQSH